MNLELKIENRKFIFSHTVSIDKDITIQNGKEVVDCITAFVENSMENKQQLKLVKKRFKKTKKLLVNNVYMFDDYFSYRTVLRGSQICITLVNTKKGK